MEWAEWEVTQVHGEEGYWNDWAQRNGVGAFVGADERDALISQKLRDIAVGFGDTWCDVGRQARHLKRRRLTGGQ